MNGKKSILQQKISAKLVITNIIKLINNSIRKFYKHIHNPKRVRFSPIRLFKCRSYELLLKEAFESKDE